jgi:hypothetical protein
VLWSVNNRTFRSEKVLGELACVKRVERCCMIRQPRERLGRVCSQPLLCMLDERVAEVRLALAQKLSALALDEQADRRAFGFDRQVERWPIAARPG